MNPSPIEEGANIYLSVRDQRQHVEIFQNRIIDQQTEVMKMLYNCAPIKER